MSGVATAIAGTALVGGTVAYLGGQAQASAARNATNAQTAINDQNQANEQPWNTAGQSALAQLASGNIVPGMTTSNGTPIGGDRGYNPLASSDPGYQFRLSQGMNAIGASAAASGEAGGGATQKAMERYTQDYATNEYNNAYNQNYTRLAQIAGFGQAAVAGGVASNLTTGQQIGNNTMSAANANSATMTGIANSAASGVNSGINYLNTNNLINSLRPQTSTAAAGSYSPSAATSSGSYLAPTGSLDY